MLIENRIGELIETCRRLLKIRSYSGNEGLVVSEIKSIMHSLGFDEVYTDKYGSITGCIKGNRPGAKILFDGHVDTVPVPEPSKWNYDPFGAVIENDRIYGRGASDMKGALSAMICAASYFVKDLDRDFPGEVYVAGTVHEECFEGIAAREITSRVKPDYVVIGEASSLNIKRGQRGRAEVVLETYGKPAHSANPEEGRNAVYFMTSLIEEIKKLEYKEHEFLGKGILVLTDIISSPYPGASVVPDYCRATFDRRLLVGEGKNEVLQPIKELISNIECSSKDMQAKVSFAEGTEKCYTDAVIEAERFFPAWLYDENDSFVQAALEGLKSVGLNPEITHYAFCTNGSHYAGEAGIKTIGFGPSRENQAHTIDEYIEIEQLISACKGYYGIMKSVLK